MHWEQLEQKSFQLEAKLLAAESERQSSDVKLLRLQRSVEEQEQRWLDKLAKTAEVAKFASAIGQYQATKTVSSTINHSDELQL